MKPARNQIETTRRPEHPNRDQNRNQIWNNANRDFESFLRAINKLLVNLYPTEHRIQRKGSQKKRNRELGNCIDDSYKQRFTGGFGRDRQSLPIRKGESDKEICKQ